jgi:hypothetical protein
MTTEFNYDQLIEEAFLNVVHRILNKVAQHGLMGEHHFYITYRKDYPGVALPDYLMDEDDDEITIVLQHQFWNLQVYKDSFEVTLSFGGAHETLHVPFAALISFYDPSEKFGLQFSPEIPEPANIHDEPIKTPPSSPNSPKTKKRSPKKDSADKKESSGVSSSNVVVLDKFRKK